MATVYPGMQPWEDIRVEICELRIWICCCKCTHPIEQLLASFCGCIQNAGFTCIECGSQLLQKVRKNRCEVDIPDGYLFPAGLDDTCPAIGRGKHRECCVRICSCTTNCVDVGATLFGQSCKRWGVFRAKDAVELPRG